jgi:hypothetical protein
MANKTFEDYFKERGALVGAPASTGDELLVLRSDTVFRGKRVDNSACLYIDNDGTTTTFSVVDTWTSLANSFTQAILSASFSLAGNVLTYVGPDQNLPVRMSFNAVLTNAVAGTEIYEIGIHVNDILSNGSGKTSIYYDAGPPIVSEYKSVSVETLVILSTGDTIEPKIRTRTGTNTVNVNMAQLIIG